MGLITDRYAQTLVAQGVALYANQDRAFMADDTTAEAIAKGGVEATEKALAAYLGTDLPTATETILLAATEGA